MVRHRLTAAAALALALVTVGAACGNDDGASVRDCGSASASGSASGSTSGSGSGSAACADSGSGSGIAGQVEGSTTDNPLIKSAVADYTTYVKGQVDDTIAATTTFTDAVRAGDVAAAKAAYAPSRQGWERIEPVASLVPEIDGVVDARVDDFEGADDPKFTGWHRLEYLLWEKNTTDGAAPFADRLDKDLQTLETKLADLEIPPAALAVGSAELIEEVSAGKITGEEDRYSGTDLWDFAANVEGSEKAFALLEPAIKEKADALAADIEAQFAKLDDQLAAYKDGDGYKPYTELTDADKAEMKTTLADLSEKLSTVAGTLGLAELTALSRRRFLARGVASTAVAGLAGPLAACGGGDGSGDGADAAGGGARYLPFRGPHQAGITHPANQVGLMAAFTVTAGDRAGLRDTLAQLTREIDRLMSGTPYDERGPEFPPLYTGAVGNPPPPADLSVVVSLGASLFDDRYGLADRRPRALEKMPFLANDRLDPARSHGDLLLTVTSTHEDVNLFALRQLQRATRATLTLHWMLDGYNRRTAARPGEAGTRNLMGFVDGTANLDAADDGLMDRYVWVQPGDGEPDWAAGGSYHVVRVIRMLVEFWDRTRLSEQEALIGRHKETGAPLGGEAETDVPRYEDDPDGDTIPLDAHIRLANPRTRATAGDLIFRAGLSYSRGFDRAGQLDQGLAFVSYQRRLSQFLNTQARLAGEPLEEYIRPEGGGFYFALPGVQRRGEILGERLLA